MSNTAICPKCEASIDHLDIEQTGQNYNTEYFTGHGSADLFGENIEIEDTDYGDIEINDTDIDEEYFKCPKCERTIEPSELKILSKKDAKTKKPKPNPYLEQSRRSGEIYTDNIKRNMGLLFWVCTKCLTKVEIYTNEGVYNNKDKHAEKEVICTKCSKTITARTTKETIKI